MRRILLWALIILSDLPLFAQTVTISGHLQHDDSSPVFACAVYTSNTHYTLSDSLGHYSLSVPKNKSVTLHFEELGYKIHDLTITPKEDCIVDVTLESDAPSVIELCSIPSSCSVCGSKKVVPILVGLPSKKGWRQIKRGKYIWGGCSGIGADYGCISCGQLYRISE